jgi:hypothetical protein
MQLFTQEDASLRSGRVCSSHNLPGRPVLPKEASLAVRAGTNGKLEVVLVAREALASELLWHGKHYSFMGVLV